MFFRTIKLVTEPVCRRATRGLGFPCQRTSGRNVPPAWQVFPYSLPRSESSMPAANPNNLKELLQSAQLPALPHSAIRLLELSQNPDNGPAEFAVPIEADPGLTGQVLKFVNSSYFGFSREISSIKLAITLVGIRTIKNFALWSAVFSLMPNPKCGPFDLKSLWQDSLRRGLFARAMGKLSGLKEAEDLFAAALLQDMAVPLLAKELPQRYLKLFAGRTESPSRLSDLERAEFGWTHADAAALMARTWSLPEEFARLIESHTQLPEMLAAGSTDVGRLAVALSSMLPTAGEKNWTEREAFCEAFTKIAGSSGKTPADILGQIDKEFCDFAPVLKVAAPAVTLSQHLAGPVPAKA